MLGGMYSQGLPAVDCEKWVTMRSKNGLIFGVINVIGNFATVFQDQAVSSCYLLEFQRLIMR